MRIRSRGNEEEDNSEVIRAGDRRSYELLYFMDTEVLCNNGAKTTAYVAQCEGIMRHCLPLAK